MSRPPKNIITIYGRKPVLEVLQQSDIRIFKVHLADSNKSSPIINEIIQNCQHRNIDIRYHDRQSLSRISKNRKQDQGVAADIINPQAQSFEDYLQTKSKGEADKLIALDNITNPQNLGMIIRSVTAGGFDGLILPSKGCAKLDSLVVKASTGTLFKCRLLFCDSLQTSLEMAKKYGYKTYGLALKNSQAINKVAFAPRHILVLGNETEGISENILGMCDQLLYIPMSNGVESLNVSVTAGILAFRHLFISDNE